ncbi:MAG: hypothetical protein HYY44_08345 [Deltaproteobacteria bacterium]|nr:hypothetical protein [Deltaproteobacteria bacterium]
MKFKNPSVVIAIPLAGPMIYWRTVSGLLELERPSRSELMVFQGALVDRARNYLVEQMLSHPMKATHLFFVDADILLPSDALMRLLEANAPIVSGLYHKRIPPHEPMAFTQGKKGIEPIGLKGPHLREVEMVGAGCLLIQRKVFEKIPFPWFESRWSKTGHLSEDFHFCRKARKAGFEILVDRKVRPLHIEPMGIGSDENQVASARPLF